MKRPPRGHSVPSWTRACEQLSQRLAEAAERAGTTAHTGQTEALGRLLFGELWDVRTAPEQINPGSPSD